MVDMWRGKMEVGKEEGGGGGRSCVGNWKDCAVRLLGGGHEQRESEHGIS